MVPLLHVAERSRTVIVFDDVERPPEAISAAGGRRVSTLRCGVIPQISEP